jgi:head-tail adaptor
VIGSLRNTVILLNRVETPDEAGGASVAWEASATIFAGVELLPAIAGPADDRARRLQRLKVLVRARPGLALGGRLRAFDRDYEIVSIESDDDRGRRLYLICEEVL